MYKILITFIALTLATFVNAQNIEKVSGDSLDWLEHRAVINNNDSLLKVWINTKLSIEQLDSILNNTDFDSLNVGTVFGDELIIGGADIVDLIGSGGSTNLTQVDSLLLVRLSELDSLNIEFLKANKIIDENGDTVNLSSIGSGSGDYVKKQSVVSDTLTISTDKQIFSLIDLVSDSTLILDLDSLSYLDNYAEFTISAYNSTVGGFKITNITATDTSVVDFDTNMVTDRFVVNTYKGTSWYNGYDYKTKIEWFDTSNIIANFDVDVTNPFINSAYTTSNNSFIISYNESVIAPNSTGITFNINDTPQTLNSGVAGSGTANITYTLTSATFAYDDTLTVDATGSNTVTDASGNALLAATDSSVVNNETSPYLTLVYNTALGNGGDSVVVPTTSGYSYNCWIHWGDGDSSQVTSYDDPDLSYVYASGGIYTVRIEGTFQRIEFDNTTQGERDKLIEIKSFGSQTNGLTVSSDAFSQCHNLTGQMPPFPDWMTNVGQYFVRDCSLTGTLDLSSPTLTLINKSAFANLALGNNTFTTIILGKNLATISNDPWEGVTTIIDVYSYAMIAPTFAVDGFTSTTGATLHIPAGATGYDAGVWSDSNVFSTVIEDL